MSKFGGFLPLKTGTGDCSSRKVYLADGSRLVADFDTLKMMRCGDEQEYAARMVKTWNLHDQLVDLVRLFRGDIQRIADGEVHVTVQGAKLALEYVDKVLLKAEGIPTIVKPEDPLRGVNMREPRREGKSRFWPFMQCAMSSYARHCENPLEAAREDLLGQALEALENLAEHVDSKNGDMGMRDHFVKEALKVLALKKG